MIMKNEPLPSLDPLKISLQPHRTASTSIDSKNIDPSPSKLPSGAKVVGNYLLGKNIGQGTFGKVHLAMHLPTSEKVAVKLIDKKNMRFRDIIRVKNEIQILKTVKHRNIMHLYEIIQTQKSVLLITEYLEKGELFKQIIKQKKFTEDQACIYFQQIVAGVDYLHRNRIAHRDLKPQNILIDYDNQIKIIDFGLSTEYVNGRDQRSFCGSPCYAAPEIIQGKTGYNPIQADLWSLGIILYVMLAGYLPFCDQEISSIYKQIVSCNFKIPPFFSAAAKDLIQNLLIKTPTKRLSIPKIRDHQWFNRVTPAAAYGINRGDKLKTDYDVLQRVKQLFGINQSKLIQGLDRNQKNKQTATYFILMKKMVKSYEKVESYIGSDDFNPKFIEVDTHTQENETEFSNQMTVIEGISGPVVNYQEQGAKSSKGCLGEIDVTTQWNISPVIQDEKYVQRSEFNGMFKSVSSFLMSFIPHTDPFQELFANKNNKQSRIKRLIFEKKQAQFYMSSEHKKARLDLHLPLKRQTLFPTYQHNKHMRTQSINYEVKNRKQTSKQIKSTRRETISSRRKANIAENKTELSVQTKKKPQKLLPYLNSQQLYKQYCNRQKSKAKMKNIPPSLKSFK